ncbi:HNH endonuclease [Chitinophaga silvatica]|uniref:HNH endonuclease n=1 Tax=Chitinophaga silvatica TaxID=2282649 RepID=A0A3E1YB29_9BACT|nr:HNH endonuclease [Chitinophaga silvatica]RFS23022.1 HNH endonuclease [Chitinophaga silvatica]
MKRNPKWHEDEIILALDLYFSPDRGIIDSKNPKIIELSELLNKLPLGIDKTDEEKFRNVNGVTLKLSNFAAIDPTYKGKGMLRHSKLDRQIFEAFVHKKETLHQIAESLKNISNSPSLVEAISKIEEEDEEEEEYNGAIEGKTLQKLHKVYERDPKIVKMKKKEVLKALGVLICEVCGFDFHQFYGSHGEGYIECHHRIPLANLKMVKHTKLEDLALVCANCHRMLHRNKNKHTVETLKELYNINHISS